MARIQTASLSLLLLLVAPAAAQGLLIQPEPHQNPTQRPQHPDRITRPGRPAPTPTSARVTLLKTAIRAEIVDGVATTVIEQTFHNHGGRQAEGTWFLPLPSGAVADGFTMNVGGVEMAGEVLDANQARGVYEAIVRRKRDPGLLEYAGEGMLRARVFPIPANGDVTVTVRLRQILQPLGNVFEWQWPLRSTRYGDTGCGPISMDVKIASQTRLSTVVTPHGNAEIVRKGDNDARVTFEGRGEQLEDLRVLYGLSEQEFGLHLLTWRQLADPGYFVMLLSPPREMDKNIPRRCVQFVVDTSGSMKGDKIVQAKRALGMFLKSLRQQDLFQVVTFSSSVQTFFDAPRLANDENIGAALERIDQLEAKGGTNIAEALQQALEVDVPVSDDAGTWLGQIVFVTDGQPTVGVTVPKQILDLAKSKDRQQMRLFALGVGDEIDVKLIDDLVDQHRGARDFVRNKEKIEVKVDALCQKIAWPALTDVEVRCGELDAFDVHPARTKDLFCGEMLQVVGRYRSAGMQTVRVRGKQNGKPREFVFEVEFPKLNEKHDFVQTIWARQHTAALMDSIRRNGANKELIDEVKRLATRYGIVTPYTSQLILEEGDRLANVRHVDRTIREGRRQGGAGSAQAHGNPDPAGPSTPGAGRGGAGYGGLTTGGGLSGGDRGRAAPGAPKPDASRRLADLGRTRTGAEAVAESIQTGSDSFYLGAKREKKRVEGDAAATSTESSARSASLVQRACGRVFVRAGDDLVEQGLPADWQKKATIVEAFSDGYFALLKANPKLKDILALGDRVVFREGERIVWVRPVAKVEPPAPAGGAKKVEPAPVIRK